MVKRPWGWIAAAVSVAVVAIVASWWAFTSRPQFSAVQQQLRDFRTLSFVIDQSVEGGEVMRSRVVTTHEGDVRSEVGDEITVIANAREKQVLVLTKSARVAQLAPLAKRVARDDQFAWLEEVRNFRGDAARLPQTRLIGGHVAHGWQLATAGMEIVMWATEEGMPLEMTLNQGTPMQLLFHFDMNPPLAADLFSTRVPDGFTLAPMED